MCMCLEQISYEWEKIRQNSYVVLDFNATVAMRSDWMKRMHEKKERSHFNLFHCVRTAVSTVSFTLIRIYTSINFYVPKKVISSH
jgi:hypothetical protein